MVDAPSPFHAVVGIEGRRYRPTVDAIIAAQGCDRETARNEIARTLKAAAIAEPKTRLVELYDRAFGARCDHQLTAA